jgi:hypothetical protein
VKSQRLIELRYLFCRKPADTPLQALGSHGTYLLCLRFRIDCETLVSDDNGTWKG